MIDHLTFVTRHNAALWQTSWALIERLGVVEGLSVRLFVGSLQDIIYVHRQIRKPEDAINLRVVRG